MTAQVLDGEVAAAVVKADVRRRAAAVEQRRGRRVGLGTLMVGDDAPSAKYVSMKHADAAELGLVSRDVRLAADVNDDDVAAAISGLNADPEVDAYIVQYPFPDGVDFDTAIARVDPAKDADGLHPFNLGRLVLGASAPVACTPAGIVVLLEHFGIELAGRHVVVIGRGVTIGRPLANLLALKHGANAAVTVVHTGVSDLGAHTRTADVIVAAAGAPGILTADMVAPGAAVVAAGVRFVDGKLRSDVADDVAEVAGWLSPKVGGVGPMTRAMLFANTVAAAEAGVAAGGT